MWVMKLNWVLPDPQIIRGIHPVILQGLTTSGCHCLSTIVGLCVFRRPLRLPRLRLRQNLRRRPRLLTYRLRPRRRKDLLDLLRRILHGLRRRRPQRRRLHRPHHHGVVPGRALPGQAELAGVPGDLRDLPALRGLAALALEVVSVERREESDEQCR